ncbi:hypothetical protein Lesp02_85420 [Lentzea sp. NBRC 105346]|nr:hypothetical protein Lesp02_85420 [Lentzea sp. NBRC 105346]
MTHSADYTPHHDDPATPSLDELFRNVPCVRTVEELASPGIFESDEELEEFLAFTYAARRADLA